MIINVKTFQYIYLHGKFDQAFGNFIFPKNRGNGF